MVEIGAYCSDHTDGTPPGHKEFHISSGHDNMLFESPGFPVKRLFSDTRFRSLSMTELAGATLHSSKLTSRSFEQKVEIDILKEGFLTMFSLVLS